MSFNPIVKFPNNIFIPKIIPLVYDDTLSYYEFICKLLNKLNNEVIPALNQLGADVEDLKAAVAQLQEVVSQFETRISTNETNIANLQTDVSNINSAIDSINNAITTINNTITTQGANISDLQTSVTGINATISDIQDTIADLPTSTTIDGIEDDIDALDVRVTGLEGATFGTVTANPSNINYSYDMRDLDGVDFEIVQLSDTYDDDDIYIENGAIKFYHAEDKNPCKLVLKNVLTDIDAYTNIDDVVINFGFLLERAGAGEYQSYSNGMTISQLLDGYSGNEYFRTIKLVRNSNGCFDLEIRQYPQDFYLRVILRMFFISLGQTPMTGTLIKDFIGNPTQNLLGIIKKNAKDYDSVISTMQTNITNNTTAIGNNATAITNEATARTNADNSLQNDINTMSGSLQTAVSNINNIKTVEQWNNFSDVFENGVWPTGAQIHYFHCQKCNNIVTMEIAGRNFITGQNGNFRFSSFLLGVIRSGLRNKLAPIGGYQVQGFGISTQTMNAGNGIDVTGDNTGNSPVMLNGNTVAIVSLNGSTDGNPFWNKSGMENGRIPAYGLAVNTNALYDDAQHDAFVVKLVYTTVT